MNFEPTTEEIQALNDYMNRGNSPMIAHILRNAGLMNLQNELTDEARELHANLIVDRVGLKELVGEIEVGLRPDAARAQKAVRLLVQWLELTQNDWIDVQRRVQDANDKLRWREADVKAATEAFEEVYRLAQWNADGQDEINEFTPDLIIQGLEGSLTSIRLEVATIMARLKAHE